MTNNTGFRGKVVFLGTPHVAARVLEKLLKQPQLMQVIAVVTQPPARSTRSREAVPSPVHAVAIENGVPVLTPESAKDPEFLQTLRELQPDLCITAAYGNVLPQAFLDIPRFGTLNIHPSLLPRFRGAAPVQRSLEEGVEESGVTILYTVRAMDAGPIVFQKRFAVNQDIKAPQLLETLFDLGADTLIEGLPAVFSGRAPKQEQDASYATHAKKMQMEEGLLNFSQDARVLHNKVRAFAGWPGTRARLAFDGKVEEVKIVTTRIADAKAHPAQNEIVLAGDCLWLRCENGSILGIVELQPPGKRVLSARDFWNGLKAKHLTWL